MDNNGLLDLPMNLEAVSSKNKLSSRDMPDEPTAPRRNSTDDTDTTRPRKRPAVMAGSDECGDALLLSQSNAQCTHLEDSQMKLVAKNAPILRDSACDDVRPSNVTKPTEITEISKTIRLRTSHSQNTEGESRLSSLPSVISDDNIPTAAPKLACSTQSLSDCGRVSISSNSSDLEEIDTGDIDDVMNGDIESIDRQTFDDENYHLDGTTQSDLSYGEIADQMLEILSNIRDDKMSILETIADEISTGLSPIQELRGFTQALTTIISHHNYNTSEFESKYLYDRVLCDEVPSMVVSLLKRTCHFSDEFFEPENGPDGIQCIVQFFAVVVRLLGLFIQLDISHLKSSQSGEYRDLFSPVALSVAPSMLKQSRLYELIADSRPSIYSSFAGVLGSFLEPDGFLENVHLFATLLVEKTSIKSGYVRIATQLNILSASLLRSIHLSEKESVSTEICNDIKFTVPRRLSKYFITMENQLSKLLDLQLQALDLREFLEFLDSVVEVGRHLHNRVPLDGRLQDRLRLLVGQYRIALKQREVVLLGEATLRFPTFLKMLASSRMDFRLRGLNCMTDSLLNYWRNNSYDDWRESAVLRFVVDFLIVNKVVEYLVGPESHYELVRRCGNVPSFLLVSGSISTEILDALWQPVLDNRDPRVVQATLHMHGEMSTNMGPDHIVMLCGRISRIPFSSFDSYLMDLVGQLIERIRMIYEGGRWADLEDLEILEPYKMLIRLMRLASEQVESISVTSQQVPSNAFDIANRNLSRLVETGPAGTIRKQIFIDCVSNIREMNDHTTGNTTAILTILRRRSRNARSDDPVVQQDIHLLVHELELPQLLVKEISRFVNVHRGKTTSLTMRKLDSRLELLKFILNYSPQCLLKEEHAQLWKCIIGEEALGTFERDQGFEFYSHFATNLEFRSILDTIYCELFPKLHPKCFSPHVLDFCKNSLQYLNRTESSDETSIVEIKGIDQLWRIILTTSDEKLVNDVVDLLIWVYLESSWILQAAPCAVQATHFYIVERCISQLTSSAHYVVNRNNISGGGEIRLDHQCNDIDQATREYLRSLQILEGLVKGLRSNPRYIPRNTAKNVYPKGEPLIVRLRCNTNGTNIPEKTITMGIENTGGDLLFIISTLMSNGKNRVMLSGRELKQGDDTSKTLGELGFSSDRVLTVYNIQDPRSEKTMGDYSSDIVQDEIMRHFEALYSLLDLSEPYSLKAWLFLRYFPANALIKKHVMDPNISWGDLYPQNKPFKCLYSLYALSRLLSEQKSTMVDLTTFIRISVPRLIEALGHSDTQDFSELNFQTSLNLKSELLSCLAVLLQEPVSEKTSSEVFTNPEKLVMCLLRLLRQCLISGRPNFHHLDKCIAHTIRVLFESAKINCRVWNTLIEDPNWKWLVKEILVDHPRDYVRQSLSDAITALFSSIPQTSMDKKKEFGQHFWSVLCEIISSGNEGSFLPGNSEQLFGAAICTFAFIGDVEISSLDLPALFNTWIEQLCTQPVTEAVGRPQENHVIMGYARLLRLCLRFAHHHPVLKINSCAKRSRIMSKLWQELLFPNLVNCAMEISKTIPILHEDTRTELYNLLLDMVRTPDDLRQLVLYNHELFDGGVTLPDVCYIERDRWLLGPTGIGGLQNLSNTCYLNSLVTQLFMNRSFRDFILQLPIDESEDARRTSFCLQVLFARMQEGFDRAADPKDLVESLRDFAGEPIDPTVQMDVDEFFNLLFDRLESEMSGNETRSLFRSFYGGLLVQQVKSKECPHISERTEAFSAIQCDIKGKSTLQESLKAYVEGEAMEGDNKYRCTTCDRLVDAVKRTCLKDIPDHLILHLKRFDFDLQTMHRSKINDFFEFPITLDMAPYSMSHLSTLESGRDPADSSSDDFELVGVLVHTGTAESGHYYSYIRDRLIKQEIPSWFEFNDSEVTFFNPSTIPAACYGGSDNFPGGGYSPNKSFSAYMLFYQRSASLKTSQFAQDLSAINLKDSPIGSLCLQISQDNQNLLKQYCMCGTNYTAFLQGIISTGYKFSTLNFKDGEQILLLALRGLEKICSRFKDCGEWDRLLAIIQKLIMNNEHYCKYFLEWASDEQIIRSLIISNPFSAVRQTFSRMILAELDRLRHIAPALYGMNDLEDSVTSQSKCILYKICAGFSDTWNWLQYNPKSWCEYFGTLISVCMLGPNECECVLSTGILKNILQMLSDVYVDESRVNIRFQNFQKILEKPRLQAATKPAKLLNLLMARTSIFLRPCKDENARISTPTRPFPLTVDEHRIALSRESLGCNFLSRLIELPGTTNEAKKLIFNIVSTPNAPAEHRHLKTILRTLMYGVDIDPAAQAQPFLECLKSFVSATSSEVYIEDIIKKVADEIPTIGASGGSEHLAFFQGLTELHGPKTNAVPSLILKYISSWAPTLLMYHDEEVRDGTEQLLEEILFSALEESHCSKKPIECLTNGCFEFINGKLPNLRQGLDEHTFKNALRVLDRSGEWQENAEDFNSRLDDIKCHIERLIFEEEGDGPELESDVWECSDAGSETPLQIGVTTTCSMTDRELAILAE